MRKLFLKACLPLIVLAMSLSGLLSPKAADAFGGVCNYYCVDPELTCCITCHWMGSECVCPEYCTDDGLN